MQNNRILTIVFVLLVTPPMTIASWMIQKERAELRAMPPSQLPGRVLMIHSPNCGGCKEMLPMAKELQDLGFPLRMVNINEEPNIGSEYGIRGVPTFIYFVNGKEQYRVTSMMNRAILEDFCRGIDRMSRHD